MGEKCSLKYSEINQKIALITGGNAGVGFALAQRLLDWDETLCICLACRSKCKAESARSKLLQDHPRARIDIVIIDVSSLQSVYHAASNIRNRYRHIDYMFMNAGIMPVSSMDWVYFGRHFFSKKGIRMLQTGDGLLKQSDRTTKDGFKEIFTTNLFGHFILIQELCSCLGDPHGSSQVIWTSSSNAKRQAFSLEDVQHSTGKEPYSSSKYASDLVSVALNVRLNNQGVYSHSMCPGLVLSNITYGIMPRWIWLLIVPLIFILRLFVSNMTNSPKNGAEAMLWLVKQNPEMMDPLAKYNSRLSFTGSRYTEATKLDVSLSDAMEFYEQLLKMEAEVRCKYKTS